MALSPLNGLVPITGSLLSSLKESSRTEVEQNAALTAGDSVEFSMRAEQVLGQRINATKTATDTPAPTLTSEKTTVQGDSVTISQMGKEALKASQVGSPASEQVATAATGQTADASAKPAKNVLATATLNSGATVSITASAYANGEEKPFYLAPDQKITAEITKADGSTQTLAIKANTVISEDDQGNLLVWSGAEKKGNDYFDDNFMRIEPTEILQGTNGNDVIINLNGVDEIHAGTGNDTVISFDYANKVDLGEGDNTLKAQG